ncbi:Putative serine protease HhoA precursor [Planctomycetes bacterium MalM25]|nr:Putative serine protease HhoA precursor [Planctomycetes bacterium MalM25]
MSSEEQVEIKCLGCDRVYYLPPAQEDRRARCRACGDEFTIPATPVSRRPRGPERRRRVSAPDTKLAADIAANATKLSQQKRRDEHGGRSLWMTVSAAAIAALLLLCFFYFFNAPQHSDTADRQPEYLQRGRVGKLAAPRTEFEFQTLADLIESVEPAIVQINTNRSIGSGFVVDPAGLIVTCHHCVDQASSARVTFANEAVMPVVGLRAFHAGADLAVIQVQTTKPLPALPLAMSAPRKGEPVVTFGSPAGLSFTVSEGSVSALRTVDEVAPISHSLRSGGGLSLNSDCDLVQFTATTMPGHSGGPIVDYRGNVIGITSFALPHQGRSFEFAISYEEIRGLVKCLNEKPKPLKECWPEEAKEFDGLLGDKPLSGVRYGPAK